MNRYFFNFRSGNDVSRDRLGMYLPNIETARAEALRTCRDLSLIAELSGEPGSDCELQVADAAGEALLAIPVRRATH